MSKKTIFRTTTTTNHESDWGGSFTERQTDFFKNTDHVRRFLGQVDLDGDMKRVRSIRLVPLHFSNPKSGIRGED